MIKCTRSVGVIMRGGLVKQSQCVIVKLLATVPSMLWENKEKKKQGVNLSQEWFM